MSEPTMALAFGGPLHGRMIASASTTANVLTPTGYQEPPAAADMQPYEVTATYNLHRFWINSDPTHPDEGQFFRVWTTNKSDRDLCLATCLAIGSLAALAAGWRPTP